MERGRIAKSKEAAAREGATSEYYLAGDLWVGAHVDFNSHRFILIDCDEYALRYMEARPSLVTHRHTCVMQDSYLMYYYTNSYVLCVMF